MKQFLAAIAIVFSLCLSTASAQKYGNGQRTITPKSSSSPSVRSSSSPRPPSQSSSNVGSKPKSSNNSYDAAASLDKKRDESQEKFQQYQKQRIPVPAPPPPGHPAYATPNGKTVAIDEKESSYWKGRLDQQKMQSRDDRRRAFYGSRYSTRPRVFYDDGIADDFYWYLRDQPPYIQARWLRDHQYEIDQRRYNDMVTNAAIAALIIDLNNQNVPRGTHWAPSGVDPDLMYQDHYIQQSIAVTPVTNNYGAEYVFWIVCRIVFGISCILVMLCIVAFVYQDK